MKIAINKILREKEKEKKKSKFIKKNNYTIFVLLGLILGLMLLIYPYIGQMISRNIQNKKIEEFKKIMQLHDDRDEKEILSRKIGEMLGYIEIEKIDLSLPIYNGTTDEILLNGIGYMKINTDIILFGHSGISTKILFDNLFKLSKEDEFKINILGNEKKCIVINIEKMSMSEFNRFIEKIEIQKYNNNNNIILVTCTPKYINTHRLVISGIEKE